MESSTLSCTSFKLPPELVASLDSFRIGYRLRNGRALTRTALVRAFVEAISQEKASRFIDGARDEKEIASRMFVAFRQAGEPKRRKAA